MDSDFEVRITLPLNNFGMTQGYPDPCPCLQQDKYLHDASLHFYPGHLLVQSIIVLSK